MKMSIIRCKISKKKHDELLQLFIAKVTARTAADLVGISRHTATLYYQKIKGVILYNLERGGNVYTKIVQDTKTDTLLPIIRRKIVPDSVVYTDFYRSYNVLSTIIASAEFNLIYASPYF